MYLPGPDSEVTHQKEKSLFRRADPRSNSRMSLASSWSMINSMRMLMALFLSIVYYKLTVHVPSAVRTCISHLVKIVGNSFSESLCSCCSQCFLDCSSPPYITFPVLQHLLLDHHNQWLCFSSRLVACVWGSWCS